MKERKVLRIALEFAALAVIYLAALKAMAHWRVMEVLLAPGAHSVRPYVAAALLFVMLRGFLVVLAPGWFTARAWLALTAREKPRRQSP